MADAATATAMQHIAVIILLIIAILVIIVSTVRINPGGLTWPP